MSGYSELAQLQPSQLFLIQQPSDFTDAQAQLLQFIERHTATVKLSRNFFLSLLSAAISFSSVLIFFFFERESSFLFGLCCFFLFLLCFGSGSFFLLVFFIKTVLRVVAREVAHHAISIKYEEMIHQPVHKITVVRNDEQAALELAEEILQHRQCWQVEIVGGLIQYQEVWIAEEDAQQVQAFFFLRRSNLKYKCTAVPAERGRVAGTVLR